MLKTQGGNVLQIESEPLALAVAEEWASQEEHLHMSNMRLTGLAFTAQDNPLHATKESITTKILEYLHGDTILYWNDESAKLENHCSETDAVSAADAKIVEKWLMSYNFWALTGMQYAVESVKSVLLPYSVVTFKLGAAEAVHCATIEQKTQSETWGTVEWAHDIEQHELTARLSAGALFVYFNTRLQLVRIGCRRVRHVYVSPCTVAHVFGTATARHARLPSCSAIVQCHYAVHALQL
ncbi:unnamed protein product [Heligmosomoides polygyrus]|uniref:ATP synthase mitochondrial F1 complex assembly factor 2 n=1 Tax=Heligmosomoides polygyrus TaxID=6339 RepID=A0A3P8ASY3_HELPZ|nr:unnamed protein product [Heligmosomoides polygyrus]